MDIFKKLPIELQRVIMDYYFEIKHVQKMKQIQNELPKKCYRINKCFTMNLSLRNEDFRVFHTFSPNVHTEECIRALRSITNCKCCNRHQQRRPTEQYILQHKKLDYSFLDEDNDTLQCTCNCRHLSRWIVRGYTENYSPILLSLRHLP